VVRNLLVRSQWSSKTTKGGSLPGSGAETNRPKLDIARHGPVEFFHYDPYGQALAKLQRRHDRDLRDVHSFCRAGLIHKQSLREMFTLIKPQLIRYPAVDPASFESAVLAFCSESA
jgi:hypothetical protein